MECPIKYKDKYVKKANEILDDLSASGKYSWNDVKGIIGALHSEFNKQHFEYSRMMNIDGSIYSSSNILESISSKKCG